MKEKFLIFFKGFIIGGAIILPGFSGSICALLLNCYEDLLNSINNIKNNFKKSISFLFPFSIGAIISIILLFFPLMFLLDNFPFLTLLFFSGLLIGGIKSLINKCNKLNIFDFVFYLLGVFIIIFVNFLPSTENISLIYSSDIYFILYIILVAFVSSFCMIAPGISLTFSLITLGFYESFIEAIKKIFINLNEIYNYLPTFIILGISIIIFILIFSKLISIIIKKYTSKSYMFFIGATTSNIFLVFFDETIFLNSYNESSLILCYTFISGLFLMLLGYLIIYYLEKRSIKKAGEKNEIR